jgi:predicted transcriptional regulator of viral defense system
MRALPAVDRLARRQSGVIARDQLLGLGVSRSAVTRAVRRGQLLVLGRGVYRFRGAPLSRRAARFAAVLLAGEDGALARWTAAELHGFAEPRSGRVHLVVPHERLGPSSDVAFVKVTRTRNLPSVERDLVDGLAVTAPARTLLDLAPVCSEAHLAELVAAALRTRGCTLSDLEDTLRRHPGATARGRLVRVVALLGDDAEGSRSDVEVAALAAVVEAGLPRPDLAHRVRDRRGRFVAEVDLAYPAQRIAIEIDGYRWHSSPASKLADERRQNRLVLAGWTVLRFSADEVRRRPDEVVATIAGALEQADPVFG